MLKGKGREELNESCTFFPPCWLSPFSVFSCCCLGSLYPSQSICLSVHLSVRRSLCQNWREEKNFKMWAQKSNLLYKCSLKTKISDLFRPPTLTSLSFAAPLRMIMQNSSNTYLFSHYLINSILTLLSYVLLAQRNPISIVLVL